MSLSDIVFPLHISSLIFSVVGILLADHKAFRWFSGKELTLDRTILLKYHHHVLAGLSLMVITGATLFWPMREYLLTSNVFYLKMFFVSVLVVNSFFIGRLMNLAVVKTYGELSLGERFPLVISGVASTFGWLGAFASAFFLI